MGKNRKRRFRNILREWGDRCIICGEPFYVRASITREHIIPKSTIKELGLDGLEGNLACSHYKCNKFRGTMSIYEAAFLLEEKRKKWGVKLFRRWINECAPNKEHFIPKKDERFE